MCVYVHIYTNIYHFLGVHAYKIKQKEQKPFYGSTLLNFFNTVCELLERTFL